MSYTNFPSLVRFICAATVATAFIADAEAPPGPDAFPLMGWWGTANENESIHTYRAAGFSVLPVPLGRVSERGAELGREVNLKIMLIVPGPSPKARELTPAMLEYLQPVHGIIAADGATLVDVEPLGAYLAQLRSDYPDLRLAAALDTTRTGDEWREAIPELARNGLDAFCFRFFPLGPDNETDYEAYFSLLALSRQLQASAGADFWSMVQVTPFAGRRRASESDIRFQAYAALAHGARGLAYFAYSDPPFATTYPEWGPAMVDDELGLRQYGYGVAAQLNRELRRLTPILAECRSTGVYFTGDVPKNLPRIVEAQALFSRIVAPRAVTGFFEDGDGTTWVLLVNLRHGDFRSSKTTKSTIQVFVDSKVSKIVEIDRRNGFEKPIPFPEGNFTITIPGGTGSLLRVETAPGAQSEAP